MNGLDPDPAPGDALPARPEVAVYIATSLDGCIARADGSIDWLMQAQAAVPAGEDFGYAAFMAGVDALLMGRKTFETVAGFDPWPYAGKPVHVLTRQPGYALPPALQALNSPTALQALNARTALQPLAPQALQVHCRPPAALLGELHAQGVRRLYLDGGELIQSFMRAGWVDSMTITTVPVLIGQGRPLWGALPADQRWQLASVRHWGCGFVQSCYSRYRG